ncbi:site-specific integrase [Kitasatospora herbaricolor]|uniref:tyrosine-type recombinase/integrase n=1 Tax=Kitasatospora herbaricolor TaxID=68217 RepID=UPI00174E0669|nr:site-specific integrase [Kitasatospora herbaricolor]MDQ0309298.1 integrase [Kitasatospora herbaricolor]GGV04252.1 site-specific integrase [Kitasatospora herbaricolor]
MADNDKRTRRPNGTSSIYLGGDGKWHGRITVGVKDDGKPDRRHVERKTQAEVIKAVRELEKLRDAGTVRKPGKAWTVEKWLMHWVENIAPLSVSENTIAGYEVAVRVHLVPGLGAHRLERLEAEHLERFYKKMQAAGSKAGTAHQVHRTIRVALGEAVRRRHLTINVAKEAKAPRLEEEEIQPYSVEEVQKILLEAGRRRHPVRWVVALALGLRQGEALGLKWSDLDLETGIVRLRRGRLRPKYEHGCAEDCGRKAGFCKQRKQIRRETKETKSRAGRRPIPLPDELISLFRKQREAQDRERQAARQLWVDKGYVFTSPTGEPLNPNTDYHEWKDMLQAAGVRDARLHDARHTAGTVLLILGVPERIVMAIMGWSSTSMAKRYQHVTDPILRDTARKIQGLLWGPPADGAGENAE